MGSLPGPGKQMCGMGEGRRLVQLICGVLVLKQLNLVHDIVHCMCQVLYGPNLDIINNKLCPPWCLQQLCTGMHKQVQALVVTFT